MRIAFIVGGFPKLSETFILRQITGLIDLGHQVDIYARREIQESAVQPEIAEYGLLERAHYFNMPTSRLGRLLAAQTAALGRCARHPAAILKCLNRFHYRSTYAVLNNVVFAAPFLDQQYDTIFCHWGGNGIDFIFLKEVLPRTRFVTMFHGDDFAIGDEEGPEIFGPLRRLGDGFVVATDCYGRATLQRYDFEDRKIFTQRYGIPAKSIKFRERQKLNQKVQILSVARLVPKKGLELGIRAAVALQVANPRLRVLYRIIGDGSLYQDLHTLIHELKAERTVFLLGAMTTPEVMQWMHDSDIYLLPSLMEQAGYVLLEAQASGLPVIATRVGGVPDMIDEGKSGILVPPGDAAALTRPLQYLIDQPGAWSRMGREGRRHVEQNHDINQLSRQLAEILRG